MIITKTPYRISFFGGGSDYPEWYKKRKGSVISATIDKHIYITCRYLPPFFPHKYRVVWSKIEIEKNKNNIKHPAVKGLLKYLKINNSLEIHYDGDLPAKSGMGSSSVFVVGLLKALCGLENKSLSSMQLAKKSINFEQNFLKHVVGAQDQTASSIGGFNKIVFLKKNISVKRIGNKKNLRKLNDNILLVYTGLQRTAHVIASQYVNKLGSTKQKNIEKILEQVSEGEKILKSNNIDDFGRLLNEAWMEKKSLSNSVSNHKIDQIYDLAMDNGAYGGKLLGAGGGGFFIFYMKKNDQKRFLKKSKKLIHVPFKFTSEGSKIIYKDLER